MRDQSPASTDTDPRHLLDNYSLIRSRSADEADILVGRALSPHRLGIRGNEQSFDAHHDQICLNQVSPHVLSYTPEVGIEPGESGGFYLIQLPLQGRARLRCDRQKTWVDSSALSVLHPRAHSCMIWSSDCSMIMLEVPSSVPRGGLHCSDSPPFRFTQSRKSLPSVTLRGR